MKFVSVFILSVFIFLLNASEINSPANIFVSGNNKFVMPVLLKSFYRKYPDAKVLIQYGSTGDLTDAILNEVNYDILLGADMQYAQKIYDAKKALNPPKEYARGSLILFIPADKTLHQKKIKVLKNKKIKHITIANKKTAPYGKASIEALQNSGMLESVKDKIRYSTDVSTVITNVMWYDDAGFLSKSAVNSLPIGYRKEGVNWIEIDQSLYKPIIQGYVISQNGSKNINSTRFIEFLLSKEGREIYKAYGYK
ncbi:MAG: molybdate ABC transporter substrate-binding protein [Sulfurimonas sp.]|nr:molybdate ABC transporter substrate-binding protein [Sulfurimonas sp.]